MEQMKNVVTVSPKFQIVLPKAVREKLKLAPGQKIQTVVYDDRVILVPLRPAKKMRGFLQGIETDVPREGDRV